MSGEAGRANEGVALWVARLLDGVSDHEYTQHAVCVDHCMLRNR